MNLEDWIGQLTEPIALPPRELRSPKLIDSLVTAAMGLIRQDYRKAKIAALHAEKLGRWLREESSLGKAARIRGHVELLAGRSKAALKCYERAWRHFESDPVEQATTAVAMIQALAYVGEYDRAFEVAEIAIRSYLNAGDEFRAARVQANLGNVYHRLDRYAEAEIAYQRALPVLAANEAVQDLAIVMRNYGVCLMGLHKFGEAEPMYAAAREVFEAADQRHLLLEVDLNRAYLMGRRGDVLDALHAYRDVFARVPEEAPFELGHCFLDQADFLLEAGLFTDADRAAGIAADTFLRLDAKFELGKSRLIQARAQLALRQVNSARTYFLEARGLIRRNSSATWMALLHQTKSELAVREGNLAEAYRHIQLAENLQPAEERVASIRQTRLSLAMDRGDFDSVVADLDSNAPEAMKAKYFRLTGDAARAEFHAKQTLTEYDRRRVVQGSVGLRRAMAVAQQEALSESFLALNKAEDRLAVVARIKDQALAEMIAAPSRPRLTTESEESVQAASHREHERLARHPFASSFTLPVLSSDERLVEFFDDGIRLHAFLIDSDGVSEVDCGASSRWREWEEEFRFHCARRTASSVEAGGRTLDAVRRALGPILDGPQRLVIGRDGPIFGLPLHILAQAEGRSVSYLPNSAVYAALGPMDQVRTNPMAMLCSADQNAPLINAERDFLVKHLDGQACKSVAEFFKTAPACSLIHLAAHGMVREDAPLFSALKIGDEKLTVLQLLGSDLQADLIVFSGCSTAMSYYGEYRDSQGFAEAALIAGCRSVIAAQGDVRDDVAAFWMQKFYGAITSTPIEKAYALAQSETKAEFSETFDWGAFALFGKFSNSGVSNGSEGAL